jgi:hypothetical protein
MHSIQQMTMHGFYVSKILALIQINFKKCECGFIIIYGRQIYGKQFQIRFIDVAWLARTNWGSLQRFTVKNKDIEHCFPNNIEFFL